jgi:hypothetical protein
MYGIDGTGQIRISICLQRPSAFPGSLVRPMIFLSPDGVAL